MLYGFSPIWDAIYDYQEFRRQLFYPLRPETQRLNEGKINEASWKKYFGFICHSKFLRTIREKSLYILRFPELTLRYVAPIPGYVNENPQFWISGTPGQGDAHIVLPYHDPAWFDYTKNIQTNPALQTEDDRVYSDQNVNTLLKIERFVRRLWSIVAAEFPYNRVLMENVWMLIQLKIAVDSIDFEYRFLDEMSSLWKIVIYRLFCEHRLIGTQTQPLIMRMIADDTNYAYSFHLHQDAWNHIQQVMFADLARASRAFESFVPDFD